LIALVVLVVALIERGSYLITRQGPCNKISNKPIRCIVSGYIVVVLVVAII
jgi:hypothetical protein